MKNRLIRINDEIKREISSLLQNGLKDPRMAKLATATRAEASADLKHCKVYISILGNDSEKESSMIAINSAKGFIRSHIAKTLNLRQTPDLSFVLDDSAEYEQKISKILEQL